MPEIISHYGHYDSDRCVFCLDWKKIALMIGQWFQLTDSQTSEEVQFGTFLFRVTRYNLGEVNLHFSFLPPFKLRISSITLLHSEQQNSMEF